MRALRIAAHLVRASLQSQAQYRLDFVLQIGLAVFWVGWNVAPLWLIFQIRAEVAGWQLQQAMLVMSAFLILKALLEGVVMPNLAALVEHLRTGTFDFLLLKPVDSQLLVSTARVLPAKLVDLAGGFAISIWSLASLDPGPSSGQVLAGVAMLASGAAAMYAIWMIVICSAFWFVKIDNLSFLFTSFFDAARWPISIFRGWVRILLTYLLPVAVMTSYPAMALLGRLDARAAFTSAGMSLALLLISRLLWMKALTHYASASS